MMSTENGNENGNNQLHSVNLKISGMSCAACAARIEKGLSKLTGVASVRESAPLIEIKTGAFDSATVPALQALGLAVESVEPMPLEDIFVTTVHGSRNA